MQSSSNQGSLRAELTLLLNALLVLLFLASIPFL